uniref:N,N-dimethylformamidase beta subunit-like C-terminal domain-containing protein n=1 Tax=Lotharella globosa TaxID=91324 RepID=A0A7S3YXP5_9EUKA
MVEPEAHLVDCGNWHVSASWRVPPDATSGLYFARAVREDPLPEEYSEKGRNWRADLSQKRVDRLHARPGANPYLPPEKAAHAYGASGHGRLMNAVSNPRASHIWFVVRDDESTSDLLFQTSDPTWQAYNGYGGLTTYGSFRFPFTHGPYPEPMDIHKPQPRAFKASYNRPITTRDYRNVNMPLHAEYPAIRFLEAAGYDVTYASGIDTSRFGQNLLKHKAFLSVGHDEYVSLEQRRNVEMARDEGVHLLFWSGNEFYWSIRWENSTYNNQPYRTMVCYKESQSEVKIDPLEDTWTGTFRDARPINPRGPMPENALTGTVFTANAQRVDSLIVPGEYRDLRFWRHTEISKLSPGSRYVTFRGVLGHEWDQDLDNGFRPQGLIRMSESHINNVQYIQDHGSVFDSGSGVHHLTLYRAPSGALVFGAGTVQWSWALDGHHDINDAPRANPYNVRVEMDTVGPDPNIQQAAINLFADMDVFPTTLRNVGEYLVTANATTDDKGPMVTIVSVNLIAPSYVVVEASGTDEHGVVAGVEISLNGGSTWHPCSRNGPNWRYSYGDKEWDGLYDSKDAWDGSGCGLQVLARGIDDSCNIGEPVEPPKAIAATLCATGSGSSA